MVLATTGDTLSPIQAFLGILFVIPSDVGALLDLFNFATWFFYGLTMIALMILRYTMRDAYRPFKVRWCGISLSFCLHSLHQTVTVVRVNCENLLTLIGLFNELSKYANKLCQANNYG